MGNSPRRRAVLIAGPTASGKSALALRLASERGAVIVNTDALQVYDGLRLLTARPSDEEMALAPHRLYGSVPPEQRFSVGDWARAVSALLAELGDDLVFVGGTGLYFEALVAGFADVPLVSAEVVERAGELVAGLDRAGRARLLADRDPAMAARLETADPQRVVRALAVIEATGRSLASYQDTMAPPLLEGFELERVVLSPPRDVLRERIARRFDRMLEAGAVEEVRQFLARGLDPGLPAMKSIGVPELGEVLAGKTDLAAARDRAVIASQQYAKRQRTWFRGRMADWEWRDA